jgi:superfamily II DNA helicase RecQ
MVFSEHTLASVAEKLPATLKALSGIKGVGVGKAEQHGAALIQLIRDYQQKSKGAAVQNSLF